MNKSGIVLTVTSGKGGVGKSTAVANLGVGIAQLDKKVIAVDFDIGLRNLDMLLGLENRIVYDIIDVMEGVCNMSQAIIPHKKIKNLYFLPASQTKDKTILQKDKVEILINKLKEDFDYILIDSPAGIESGFEHAIFLADKAIIVVNPEVSSIRDSDRVIGIIDAKSQKAQKGEEVEKKLIINRLRPELVESGDMINVEGILDILGIDLIGIVPEDSKIISSTNKGEPTIFNNKSISGQSYMRIVKRMLGEDIPIVNFKNDNFFSSIKKLFMK